MKKQTEDVRKEKKIVIDYESCVKERTTISFCGVKNKLMEVKYFRIQAQ